MYQCQRLFGLLFCWGWFTSHVIRPRVPRLSVMALQTVDKTVRGCKSTASCIVQWFSYFLWHLEQQWSLVEAYGKCKCITSCLTCHSVAPHHPQPTIPYRSLVVLVKNYLKWWAIQLAIHCRVHKMNDLVSLQIHGELCTRSSMHCRDTL